MIDDVRLQRLTRAWQLLFLLGCDTAEITRTNLRCGIYRSVENLRGSVEGNLCEVCRAFIDYTFTKENIV